ncbi:phytoene desaturase family protein [Phytoactinopolyspora halotolerans]|uniref:NAD(P)/FAD-dependent oxidoreductase n=1 Tax=Phytoactinopolyspora halotolerans TaxID=1981512 RepID=A0A6L9S3F9_9ACTN|nr:NAD(P)/FAD-dependent oxidoreductase [Phytoactinopolyspora halotolerans]NED99173.1 NAD(P)/FAD-dependent oxidoreductase [Phytoactinopolyspora halotolerans]
MSDRTDYDVIVVGSGLGGLSAAALLAHSGERVLVLEQGDDIGGVAHAFVRNGGDYVFDPAVHSTSAGEIVWNFLEYLGVDGDVPYVVSPHSHGAYFGDGLRVLAPTGWDAYVESLAAPLPKNEGDEIREFHRVCRTVLDEMAWMPYRMDARNLAAIMEEKPNFAAYRMATVEDVFTDHVPSLRPRALAGAAWPFIGSPPSRLSFLNYIQLLDTHLEGPRYPLGSYQRMVDAFAKAVRGCGGDILVRSPAAKVLVADGAVAGVRTESGAEFSARAVVANADARHTLNDLVGPEHLPESYLKRVNRMRPSLSVLTVFAATDLDLTQYGLAHETFVHPHLDHSANWADVLAGRPASAWMSNTTLMDPSLAPDGEHTVIMTCMAPWELDRPWPELKEPAGDAMIDLFEQVIPGLSAHLTYREVATPLAMHRFTRGYQGATYGWENTPNQFANKRLAHQTPLDGLYLSGHWTESGSSSFRAVSSGISSSKLVLSWLGNDVGATLPRSFRERTGPVPPARRRSSTPVETTEGT